jgi:hypothetical protein
MAGLGYGMSHGWGRSCHTCNNLNLLQWLNYFTHPPSTHSLQTQLFADSFRHLIGPSKQHTGDNRAKHDNSIIPTDDDDSKTHGSGNTLCSVNPKCKKLELTGYCCPTVEGVMLGCCDWELNILWISVD